MEPKPNDLLTTSMHPEFAADLEFVRRIRAREVEAVTKMLVRLECVPQFISSLNRKGGSRLTPEEQRDLIQDALLVVWRKLDQFRGASRFESWVFRVCRLEYLNALRRKRRNQVTSFSETDPECAGSSDGVDMDLRIQQSEWIVSSLERLPPEEARIVRLKHYERHTFNEIAERIECPVNTVKTYYYRAIVRLKTLLSGTDGESES